MISSPFDFQQSIANGIWPRCCPPMRAKFRITDPIPAGVLSSLLASGVIVLMGHVGKIQFLWLSVPLWILLIVLVFLLPALFALYQVHGTRVIMTFSAFHRKHWYSELLQHILVNFASRGTDVIVKIPRRDYSPADQADMFAYILTHRHHYTAGIVVPVEPHKTKPTILQFTKRFAKPVLFLDVQPFDSDEEYPPDTAYLGYDNEVGGAAAAEAMFQFLQRANAAQRRILMIGANAQTGRQAGFENCLRILMPNATVTRHDEGHFA